MYFLSEDQLKRIIKRRRQSPKTINEQIQRKLTENGIHKDELSKSMPVSGIQSKYRAHCREKTFELVSDFHSMTY